MMKKITLIAMTLVLALGLAGVGYALWSDSLYLEGTVNTGDIGLRWSQGIPWDTEIEGKDASEGVCYIDGNTLFITITDAYPSIYYHFPIDLHGMGSVPVHTLMTVTSGNPAWVLIPDMSGMQIHEGDEWLGEIVVHLDNSAEELTTYYFSVTLDYWQYNEAGPGP